MRLISKLLGALLLVLSGSVASATTPTYVIENITLIDVESGSYRVGQYVWIEGDRIKRVAAAGEITARQDAIRINGTGKFLIPGLWDMHVHSHRERRWEYHYPLFRAFGVTGVRDAGSHLGSALVAMERVRRNPLAPHVVWGSPIIDGAPPYNSFGLSAEDEASGRALVREMKRYGFDFVKVYDRLTPDAYHGIADEARKLGMGVEGHVPLSLSPERVVDAGQTLIDHLTLVLENCIPGEITQANEAQRLSPRDTDSLDMLMDDRLTAALAKYDEVACRTQFERFAQNGVWQVPTLVQMRGFFRGDDPRSSSDPRLAFTTPGLRDEWHEWSAEAEADGLANGRKVLAAQMRMIRPMADAGVGIMTGTDASSEAWVFAGASVHDEMAMLVEAGLTPLEALRAATLNPLRYLGRATSAPLLGPGEPADLVLLDADPLVDIANSTQISAVFSKGQFYDRAALDGLLALAREAAARGLQ